MAGSTQRSGKHRWKAASLAISVVAAVIAIAGWMRYAQRAAIPEGAGEDAAFGPTIPDSGTAPGRAPAGMVWISGAEFSMGAQDPAGGSAVGMAATTDSRPVHRVYVDG